MVNGTYFGYKNPGSEEIVGWGVKVPANQCCMGDQVRIVTKSGNVHRATLSKRTNVFIDKATGESV